MERTSEGFEEMGFESERRRLGKNRKRVAKTRIGLALHWNRIESRRTEPEADGGELESTRIELNCVGLESTRKESERSSKVQTGNGVAMAGREQERKRTGLSRIGNDSIRGEQEQIRRAENRR